MTTDRRRALRAPCLIPAAGPKGPALIEDLSPLGARVRLDSHARVGDRLPLTLWEPGGRRVRLQGSVRQVRHTRRGFRIGCSFEEHADSSVAAWRLSHRVESGARVFRAPPLIPARRGRRRAAPVVAALVLAALAALAALILI
jgi:hypothetical protein